MMDVLRDLRFAVRSLMRQPGYACVVAVTLALGIGANTVVFSVLDVVLLRPLPFRDPQRLVMLEERLVGLGDAPDPLTPGELADYRAGTTSFLGLAGFRPTALTLTAEGMSERLTATQVSANLFEILGVAPALGRAFTDAEDAPHSDDVVVLSDGLWRRRYDASPAIIGRTILLDGRSRVVVGIAPPGFQFPPVGEGSSTPSDVWVPLALRPAEISDRGRSFDLGVIGRLKPWVTLAEAQADVEHEAARFMQVYPLYSRIPIAPVVTRLDRRALASVRSLLWLLSGAVGFVLLIACVNVSSIVLTRASGRGAELAVRLALGAPRRRIVRDLLLETGLLAVLGGLVGLLFATIGMSLIARFGPDRIPRLRELSLDWRVVAFTAAIAAGSAALCGVAPAVAAFRRDISDALKAGGRSIADTGQSMRGILIVTETAAALVLLIGAGLLLHSFARVLRAAPGFEAEGVLAVRTAFDEVAYPAPPRRHTAEHEIVQGLAHLPGVTSAAVATHLPLADAPSIAFSREGGDPTRPNIVGHAGVSPDYFRVLGIPVLAGRTFSDRDVLGAPGVVLVNEVLARQLWPGQDAIGKRTQWGTLRADRPWLTVVGVVGNVRAKALDEAPRPTVYMPLYQLTGATGVTFVLRGNHSGASTLAAAARETIRHVDPALPTFRIEPMNEIMVASLAERRFSLLLITWFSVTAIALAAIGVYGLMQYHVNARRHELAVRMALGAVHGKILMLVLQQALALTACGVAAGLIGAAGLSRLMSTLLYEVAPLDPPTFAVGALLVLVVALVAGALPAWRATRVDAAGALRSE